MQADPFKERAPREEERAFCALFGCLCHVAYLLWKQLNAHGLLPQGGTMTHLLWTLAFLKVYPSEESLKSLFGGADIKTIRKRVDQFMTSVALLEPFVVSTVLKILLNDMHFVNDPTLMLFSASHRLSGKIARKTTLEMIVLYLSMEQIFVFLLPEDDSTVTSIVHRV